MGDISHNSNLRITDEKTLELVQLYKNEECLWNTLSENYKIKYKRKAAAEKIARILDIPGFGAKHVMTKFKNLRNSYGQELKKIAQSMATGDEELVYKPKVMWFSIMNSFIRPHMNLQTQLGRTGQGPTLVINGGVIKREPEPIEDPDELWGQMPDESTSNSNFQEEQGEFLKTEEGSESGDTFEYQQNRKRPASQNMPGTSMSCSSPKVIRINEVMSQPTKDTSTTNNSWGEKTKTEKTSDVFDHFGGYVASLLRDLPLHKALQLQPKIVEMIVTEHIIDQEEAFGP